MCSVGTRAKRPHSRGTALCTSRSRLSSWRPLGCQRRISTTRVVDPSRGDTTSCTSADRTFNRRSTFSAFSSSSRARSPFSASSDPELATSGSAHRANLSNAATARAVTASAVNLPCNSSARAIRISTFSRPSSSTTSPSQAHRRSIGSIRTIGRSGRTHAITTPGRPAPDPRSATVPSAGRNGTTARELTMWRDQILSISLGPINPRSSPSRTSISAKPTSSRRESAEPAASQTACGKIAESST